MIAKPSPRLRQLGLLAALLTLPGACGRPLHDRPQAVLVPSDELAATIAALRPRRPRPVVAVVAANQGTETTDFLVPFVVLRASQAAEVVAVSSGPGAVMLMPALKIEAQATLAAFDARWPDGADYVVVPALHDPDDPAVKAWVKRQQQRGAIIMGVCSGVRVLSGAGLLAGRAATGHWYDIDDLRRDNPTMRWMRNRRYVVDRGVVTTTGVTASIPASLALVEAMAGPARAGALAEQLGVSSWGPAHDSDAFRGRRGYVWTVVGNTLAVWGHDTFGLSVADGVDEIALALTADAYSRTYRSQAVVVAARPLKTRHGLTLIPDRATAEGTILLPPLPSQQPARALDTALADLEQRYGPATAGWVARLVEYPRPRDDRSP